MIATIQLIICRRVEPLPCPTSESHTWEWKRSGHGSLGRRGFATASQGNGVAVDSNRARPGARVNRPTMAPVRAVGFHDLVTAAGPSGRRRALRAAARVTVNTSYILYPDATPTRPGRDPDARDQLCIE